MSEHLCTSCRIRSPIGPLVLSADPGSLTGVYFGGHDFGPGVTDGVPGGHDDASAILVEACSQLAAYFDGKCVEFDLPLGAKGTPFQIRVWAALREVQYGETFSYGELAARIGAPRAVRAVGAAIGRNPIPIIVPCHRVVGADGSLTGFGGGIERKRWLLTHESRRMNPLFLTPTSSP